ncbi:MAG: hypothetical protein KDC46_14835 [Thermoleophilia bacterium]|nr:hypothetical protein [Thermoleophilia bacterium]
MSIDGLASSTLVATGFALPLMGLGALIRDRDPGPDHDPRAALRWSAPLAIGGFGIAAAIVGLGGVSSAADTLFAVGGLACGFGAMISGAALGQLLLDAPS